MNGVGRSQAWTLSSQAGSRLKNLPGDRLDSKTWSLDHRLIGADEPRILISEGRTNASEMASSLKSKVTSPLFAAVHKGSMSGLYFALFSTA